MWGAQAASLQVSAACRERAIPALSQHYVCKNVAGNYRLAACAPRNLDLLSTKALSRTEFY